jgi:hypothetical protein
MVVSNVSTEHLVSKHLTIAPVDVHHSEKASIEPAATVKLQRLSTGFVLALTVLSGGWDTSAFSMLPELF